jgi:two-component system nitrate/nitrite response regulator NarL
MHTIEHYPIMSGNATFWEGLLAKRVATVLVARNSIFREGLLLILSTTAFRVCKVAETIDDLSLQSIRTSVLFLIDTGGDHAVTALTVERVRKQNPSARIVVLSDRCELNDALVMLRAGADGYVFEQISSDALIKSLDLVMLGRVPHGEASRRAGCRKSARPVR